MDVIDTWTGRRASALRAALRMTNDEFAQRHGVAVRTVANWEAKPATVLIPSLQQVLDTAYAGVAEDVRKRFVLLLAASETSSQGQAAGTSPSAGGEGAEPLRVAIGIVVHEAAVLLVRRRQQHGNLGWQFPAGIVKPGSAATDIVVQETFNETGVHCSVRRSLGNRIYPATGVLCEYFLCDYLAGRPENRDTLENLAVEWVERASIATFIPVDQIFEPALNALEEESP